MEKLIACCGLDCNTCDARIATITDDDELRTRTAEKWSVQFNVPDMSPGMINCTGCMESGVKLGHCELCEVRNCVIAKGYDTCADCDELESCDIVGKIHQFVPKH